MRLSLRQEGAVSRSQVLAHGLTDEGLESRLSADRWQRVHPGVYATFTGPLPWRTRCHAALLYFGHGAALAGATAIALELRQEPADNRCITVAVDHRRRVRPPAGTELWRVVGLGRHVQPAREPVRMRFEVAVLLSAARAKTSDAAIGLVADACQSRRTTPAHLQSALAGLPTNMRFRRTLCAILEDVGSGAYSYLEVQYLRRVERPHGLPTGTRQRVVRRGRRLWVRDVEYVGLNVVAELDGRLGHEEYDSRARDMDRDNAAVRDHTQTARVGYRQVLMRACATAQLMADLLRAGGWDGQPRKCGPECPVE